MNREKILVAVSGGIDSIFLLHILSRMQAFFEIFVLHVNHQLRGQESDEDEKFVRELCIKLKVKFFVEKIRLDGETAIEEKARDARYEIIQKICRENKITTCFLGHNADDDVETILMNILRGTGLNGLTGMEYSRPLGEVLLVRPLLKFTRKEIEGFSLEFRTDSSNASDKFLRNKIRNKILPEFLNLNKKAKEHVLNLKQLVRENNDLVKELLKEKINDVIISQNTTQIVVDLSRYMEYNNHIKKAILTNLLKGKANFQHINRVFEKINSSKNGRYSLDLKNGFVVLRRKKQLIICHKGEYFG